MILPRSGAREGRRFFAKRVGFLSLGMALFAAAVLFAAGCEAGSGLGEGPLGVGVRDDPREVSGLVGYGMVNYWHRSEAEAFADLLADNQLTMTGIEYLPWFEGGDCGCKLGGGCSVEAFPEEAAAFVEAMRARNITTWINVVNWNGCEVRDQDDDWFRERIEEIVGRIGPDQVVLSPVSEPWVRSSPVPERWTAIARDLWTGQFAIPNQGGSGPEPMWTSFVHDFVDLHHCEDEKLREGLVLAPTNRLHSTDCSPILNPGPDRAAIFTREALASDAQLFLYGFTDEEPDESVVEAMGDEIRGYLDDAT